MSATRDTALSLPLDVGETADGARPPSQRGVLCSSRDGTLGDNANRLAADRDPRDRVLL